MEIRSNDLYYDSNLKQNFIKQLYPEINIDQSPVFYENFSLYNKSTYMLLLDDEPYKENENNWTKAAIAVIGLSFILGAR